MSVTAIILNTDSSYAKEKVYGMTVLERCLHALERGGVDTLLLPYVEEDRLRPVIERHKKWQLQFRFVDDFRSEVRSLKNGLLVLAEPLVIDPLIPCTVIEKGRAGEKVLTGCDEKVAWLPANLLSKLQSFPRTLSGWLAVAEKQETSVEVLNHTGLVCSTVHSKAEKKAVKKALIRSLTKPTDGWVSRNLNRPVSTTFSRLLAYTPVTPNQFTILTGLLGLATGLFLAMGGYWNYLIGGLLFHLTSVLDGVDGELARLKFKSSPFGQWLDTLVDNLSYLAALTGILIGIYRHGASDTVLLAGILAVVFAVLALTSLYLYLLRFKSGGTLLNVKYSFQDGTGMFDRFMQLAAAFGKRDLFALIFFFLGLIGYMPMALVYVAIMAFFVFAFSVQAHFVAARERT